MKLASKFYGDPLDWHVITDRNQIDFPLREIVAGITIIIPSFTSRALAFRD